VAGYRRRVLEAGYREGAGDLALLLAVGSQGEGYLMVTSVVVLKDQTGVAECRELDSREAGGGIFQVAPTAPM